MNIKTQIVKRNPWTEVFENTQYLDHKKAIYGRESLMISLRGGGTNNRDRLGGIFRVRSWVGLESVCPDGPK
ncbi:hypothetical protein PITCH_A420018 [uncultured Desulfobacterium sp.]|uniref:Uncharacterized protein n=1 Tax=uncultured Desulfobacterium sp. TaxID=201089 RepID=A0A445MZY1_9BACT|nr:hypothetical protein PITCH_A420018 [uncultured Desulfobacterium sp.]